jgi:tripartite-type tricarboxylate transporter receptor subunit TctC
MHIAAFALCYEPANIALIPSAREAVLRRTSLWIAGTLLALGMGAQGIGAPASAQDADYPNRPIRVIVPFGAGAGVDTAARITAEAAEKHLNQKFVIENKPGAGARLGAAMAANAAPDGYTLLFGPPAPIVVTEHFPQKMDYVPARDFRPVAVAVLQPAVLVVRPTLGVKSVDEFVAYAKNNPGKVQFGVQGLGGEMHLSLELFKKTASFSVNPVTYNAAAHAIVDLLGDRLDAMFLVIPPIKGHLDAGKLLALATLNPKRVRALPHVPTMAELGRPEMTGTIWFGYLAPAKTPQLAIDRLAWAFQRLQDDSDLRNRVADLGAELNVIGPAEFAKLIESDRARYGKIVADGNLAAPQN